MKYPKCCYQTGNEYRDHKGRGRTILFECLRDEEMYIRHGRSLETEFISISDIHSFDAITVETFTALTRENFHRPQIKFDFQVGRLTRIDFYEKNKLISFTQTEHETLGGFFLRVAKERNYIK